MKIAVIGSGAAGLTAAYLLDSSHEITLFEKESRLGGHTNTVFLPEGPDAGTPVDTGFIVFNEKNYPLLCKLFKRLGVETAPSDMAFGLSVPGTALEYCSDFPHGLFSFKRNLLRPSFLKLISEILRLNKQAKADLTDRELEGKTLGDWLAARKAGREYREWYLLPMGAAIWSTPAAEMLQFPAQMFLRFFENHGLWDLKDRPQWRFVSGGSQSYVKKIRESFRGEIRADAAVTAVNRPHGSVEVTSQGRVESFDAVVIASHADQVLSMLADPSPDEIREFSVWKYTHNEAVLHWDETLMPQRRKAWASWNVIHGQAEQPIALTYWMNRLQKLNASRDYFVTLNATVKIAPEKIVRKIDYTHPHYSFASLRSQMRLPALNGQRNTYYCGSYFGNGFHEDAVRSAVQAAEKLGGIL